MKSEQFFINDIDRAIEEKRIRVYYQPIVRSTNGKICGQEALSRWLDNEGEIFVPEDFIPALDKAGLTWKLDLYVVEQILEKFRIQKELGMVNIRQSVNISEKDLTACDMPEEIRKRVDGAGIPRDMLAIEIAEGAIGSDCSFVKEQTERFRKMGFQVWIDRFGSAGFSLDIFSRISMDLIKFDLDRIRNYESEETGRIVLSELMKMTIGMKIDTVCEGVETEEEERFLREIGCEKLQGYLYGEAVAFEEIHSFFRTDEGIPVEEREESAYYDAIGRINLYDLDMLTQNEKKASGHYFNSIPMAIAEINKNMVEFVRTNQAYREFVEKIIGRDIGGEDRHFSVSDSNNRTSFIKNVLRCCRNKDRMLTNEKMPGNLTVRAFIRYLAENPITGAGAVAIAVLSVSDSEQEMSYENIARALAADYFDLFYVDLDTESFIEYRTEEGEDELAVERRGVDFFNTMLRDAREKVAEEDMENFMFVFTKENILNSLETQGTFTMTFRMLIKGAPLKVSMKARRLHPWDKNIVIGINIIDEQAKLEKGYERKVISNVLTGTDAARMELLSLDSASFAVKSCVKLMGSGDFRESVKEVLNDIMEIAQADAARIMLVDGGRKSVVVFEEMNRPGCFPERKEQLKGLRYEVISAWEDLIGDNNAVIVENESDRIELRKNCPEWSRMMERDGVTCLVLVPLRRKEVLLGYLYVLNHNTLKTENIRERIELVSYFLSSEISNYLFRMELENLSNYDQLTGLKNRHSMIGRIDMIGGMESCSFGVLTMDLNGLKKVNDTEGHMAGDELIKNAAVMLEEEFGKEDLYRVGGDEFIMIFPEHSKEEFETKVKTFLEGRLANSGISMAVGTNWAANNADTKKTFFEADQNMYANKKAFYEKQKG